MVLGIGSASELTFPSTYAIGLQASVPRHLAQVISLCGGFSSDGFFSIKSAYCFLYDLQEREQAGFPFKLIWKWCGPQRIRTFLWKLANGRLLTNDERFKRNMAWDNLCPCCNSQSETILHAIRDCDVVTDLWESLVQDEHRPSFFSVGLSKWLEFNLTTQGVGNMCEDWAVA